MFQQLRELCHVRFYISFSLLFVRNMAVRLPWMVPSHQTTIAESLHTLDAKHFHNQTQCLLLFMYSLGINYSAKGCLMGGDHPQQSHSHVSRKRKRKGNVESNVTEFPELLKHTLS